MKIYLILVCRGKKFCSTIFLPRELFKWKYFEIFFRKIFSYLLVFFQKIPFHRTKKCIENAHLSQFLPSTKRCGGYTRKTGGIAFAKTSMMRRRVFANWSPPAMKMVETTLVENENSDDFPTEFIHFQIPQNFAVWIFSNKATFSLFTNFRRSPFTFYPLRFSPFPEVFKIFPNFQAPLTPGPHPQTIAGTDLGSPSCRA